MNDVTQLAGGGEINVGLEVFNAWYPFGGPFKRVPSIKHLHNNVNRRFLLLFPTNCVT